MNINKGEKVVIDNANNLVRGYLEKAISTGINFDVLRIVCSIKSGVKYKVVDICKSCKYARIQVSKGKYFTVNYKYISVAK